MSGQLQGATDFTLSVVLVGSGARDGEGGLGLSAVGWRYWRWLPTKVMTWAESQT